MSKRLIQLLCLEDKEELLQILQRDIYLKGDPHNLLLFNEKTGLWQGEIEENEEEQAYEESPRLLKF